jgi:acyl-CoA reductase-like NAD-dependent aldehyde dehydrogenase
MTNAGVQAPVRDHSPEEISDRLGRAREAQVHWRAYSLTQRVAALRKFQDYLKKDRERLIAVIHEETGKPRAEIEAMELDGTDLILKFFTRGAHRILKDRPVPRPWVLFNKRAYVRCVPRGVIGLVTPWNMPFLIPYGDAIPALLSGNAVVIKPSEWTTKTALYLQDRFNASGLFPEGLLQVCVGGGAAGKSVIEGVDMVLFTGSTETGRRVAAAAAERLIPAVLELGGKHPMIVAKDAPLKRASKAAIWGRFANSGQICVGVERVFVERPVYEEFCALLETELKALRQNKTEGYDTDLGRLIFPHQLSVVERHIADAREMGGRVVGGEIRDREGLLVEPTIVFDAVPGMLCMKEETFGPLLAVTPIDDIEATIRKVNTESFGLAASVWSRDIRQAERWAAQLETGLLSVNDLLSHYVVCGLPFGGFKQSGLGRRHSDEGLRMFCEQQSVLVHEFPADQPEFWWFPYDRMKSKILSWLLRLT